MLLSEFCLAAVEHIENADYGVETAVRLYTDGYRSSDPEEQMFIHASNIKYHNTDSDALIGTYFILTWKEDRPEGVDSLCRIEAAGLMKIYQSEGWEGVDRAVLDNMEQSRLLLTGFADHLYDYEKLKEHLILRPVSYTRSELELQSCVFSKFADIAMTLYLKIRDDGKNLTSIKVPAAIVNEWSVPPQEAVRQALENTTALYPPRIYRTPLEVINPPYRRGVFMGDGPDRITKLDGILPATLTTTRQLNGAMALFYPGVKERIGELYGGSYYASCTSDSDVILQSAKATTPKRLYDLLEQNNRIFPNSVLSRYVFQYDPEARVLRIVKQ